MIKSSPVIFLRILITPNNASYGLKMNKKSGQTLLNGNALQKGFPTNEGDLIAIWVEGEKSLESVAFNCGLIVGRSTVVCTTSREAAQISSTKKNTAQSGL